MDKDGYKLHSFGDKVDVTIIPKGVEFYKIN